MTRTYEKNVASTLVSLDILWSALDILWSALDILWSIFGVLWSAFGCLWKTLDDLGVSLFACQPARAEADIDLERDIEGNGSGHFL